MVNKNFRQTGGKFAFKKLLTTSVQDGIRKDLTQKHKSKYTKRPSSKRVLKRIKNEAAR